MKIAFVHQPINFLQLPDQGGSVEVITYELARRLASHCEVIVYSKKERNQKESEYYQGVLYRRIPANEDEKFNYIASGIDRRLWRLPNFRRPLFASSPYYLMYALRVAKDLKSKKCDIVHIQTFPHFAPIIRAFNPEVKIVLHMHCEWLTQLDRAMIESRLRKVDLVIGVSQYITEKIRRRFPQFAKRCKTIYNGVDVTTFVKENGNSAPKKNDTKQLLFVGRVSPEKGVHVLLEAFQKVLNQYPQAQLKLVGSPYALPIERLIALSDDPKEIDLKRFYSGSYNSHLRNQLSQGAASHVFFAGSFPHKLLINFYRNADVCVVPSVVNEPCAMPVLEAMATSVPVVATRSGGMPETVVDGETGLLVERGDASALSEAILRLLSDERLRASMGKAGRKRAVALFSWEKISRDLLVQYENLVGQ
jgi:glycosyltransferase involved in cell wall biosynthesis